MIHQFHLKADTPKIANRFGPVGHYAAVELVIEHPTTGTLTRFRFHAYAEDDLGKGCLELPWPLEIEDAVDSATILDWTPRTPPDWELNWWGELN